jgi:hypothetical protein
VVVVVVAAVAGGAGVVGVVVEVGERGEDERHGLGRWVAERVRRRGGALHVVVRARRGRVEDRQLMVVRAIGRSCHGDTVFCVLSELRVRLHLLPRRLLVVALALPCQTNCDRLCRSQKGRLELVGNDSMQNYPFLFHFLNERLNFEQHNRTSKATMLN